MNDVIIGITSSLKQGGTGVNIGIHLYLRLQSSQATNFENLAVFIFMLQLHSESD